MLWGALSASASAADQRPVIALEKLLGAPVSPGVAALLAPHASDARALERLQAALKSARPETRAAAARVAHVAYAKSLVPALRVGLATESVAEVAREQIRALAALDGAADSAVLREFAKPFGGRLDAVLLEALARTRGPEAIPVIASDEWSDTVPIELRAELLLIAARGDEARVRAAFEPLLGGSDALAVWNALLRPPYRGRELPIVVMLLGLRSPNPEIAALAAWETARRNLTKGASPELLSRQWEPPEAADPETAFAFEVLSRSLGLARQGHPAWLASLETRERSLGDDLHPPNPMLILFDADEREALRRRHIRRNPTHKTELPRWDSSPPATASETDPAPPIMSALSNLPRGVVADALAVANCKPKKKDVFGAAQVQYNVEGRPLRVSAIETDANARCESAATSLFMMTLSSRKHLWAGNRSRPQILLAFAGADCMDELDESDVRAARSEADPQPLRLEDNVQPPRLVRKVEPSYPMTSRYEGREGIVILEAVISRNGCVRQIETLKGLDPVLDYSAARAVSQWRYQPASLDGKPVDVYLTVTVTYHLQR